MEHIRVAVPISDVGKSDRGASDGGGINFDIVDAPGVNIVMVKIIQVSRRGLPANARYRGGGRVGHQSSDQRA